MRRRLIFLSLLSAVLLAVVAFGCSASNGAGQGAGGGAGGVTETSTATGKATTGTTSGPGAGGQTGSGCMINCTAGSGGSGGGVINGQIIITPASPTLKVVVGGMIPTQGFKAMLNGQDVSASVTWSYERPDVGDIAGTTFTPTGKVGGKGKLTAAIAKSTGETDVTVTVVQVLNTAGLTPQQQVAFNNPGGGPDPVGQLVYPYDQTVFPLGVLAPDLQWNGANPGDVYRLQLSEKYYSYVEYFTAQAPADHLVSETDWKNIEDSGSGAQTDPVGMQLTRSSNGTVYKPLTQTWHVAQGRLHGSVYYWELPDQCGNQNAGRVLRIKPDSPMTDQFFTNNGSCYGCHTVSRDGKKMAAEFQNGNGPTYELDLTQNPVQFGPINPGKPSGNFTFTAFNNDGTKLLAGADPARQLQFVDALSGAVLNMNAMAGACGEPAWSPSGKKIAGVCNLGGGGWIFDSQQGDLTIADVDANLTVTNQHTIVPQNGGQGRPAYPSFSPGSGWITFGRPTAGSRSTGQGALWIVAPDGTGLKQLATASSDQKSFNGVFAPLRAGGYFWIVFITRRDYGNQLVGANRQQLWITAVDDPPSAADPSHPPFYMRGQENCGKSENAYYALDPCKMLGESCVSGVDCCNGQCVKDPATKMYVCGMPPPPGMCSQDGNACKTKADCCNPHDDCVDGFCQPPIPK